MDTLVSMRVFRQVVESRSFTAAAGLLEMSVAMVSKHVKHLEQHLGTRLLYRTSRRVELNPAGTLFYERCREILDQLDEAENALGKDLQTPRGSLRLTGPAWFSGRFFARALAAYRNAYPEVQLEVHLSDGMIDLVEQGIDMALRVTGQPPPDLLAQPLARIEFALFAAPAYLASRGAPRCAEELSQHEVLTYTFHPDRDASGGWRLNNTLLMGLLAAEGAGIAVLPTLLVQHEPFGTDLVRLDLPPSGPAPTLYAVSAGRRHLTARVRSFVEFLRTYLSASSLLR